MTSLPRVPQVNGFVLPRSSILFKWQFGQLNSLGPEVLSVIKMLPHLTDNIPSKLPCPFHEFGLQKKQIREQPLPVQ